MCSVGTDLEANESRFRNAPAITSLTLSLFFGLVAIRGIELTAGYEVLPYLASILLQMASCIDGIACKIVSALCSFAKYLFKCVVRLLSNVVIVPVTNMICGTAFVLFLGFPIC